ncbi:MAG: general secretion pathway protein GspF [Dictyoglomus sp. NZ13-RE01]|nr:MAG: general secretion pathway protein GspF [Dictyoglomus sp. NZ13-RE01]
MPRFEYTAKDPQGRILKGIIEAESERDARRLIRRQRLYVISLKKESSFWKTLTVSKKVTLPELVIFTSQFATLLRSGILLTDALITLAQQTDNEYFKEVLRQVRLSIDGGESLSEALSRFPNVFPNIFISLVRTGEVTGSLDIMLDRLARYFDSQHELREKIKSALTYPTIVIIAAIGVVIFLLTFVVPTFQRIYGRMNVPLPLPTRMLLGISAFVKNNILFLFIIFIGLFILTRILLSNPKVKRWWDEKKLNIPRIGKMWRQLILTRFASTFAILLSSGILVTHSLEILQDVVGNLYFADGLKRIYRAIMEGRSLSEAMAEEEMFTPMLVRMVGVGERSGRVDEMLEEYSKFSQRELDNQTKRLTSLIEPLITLVLGGIVFFIALSMYLPMFNMVRLFRR